MLLDEEGRSLCCTWGEEKLSTSGQTGKQRVTGSLLGHAFLRVLRVIMGRGLSDVSVADEKY